MSCPLHYYVKGLGQSSPVPLALVRCFTGRAKVGLMDTIVCGAGLGGRGYIPRYLNMLLMPVGKGKGRCGSTIFAFRCGRGVNDIGWDCRQHR